MARKAGVVWEVDSKVEYVRDAELEVVGLDGPDK